MLLAVGTEEVEDEADEGAVGRFNILSTGCNAAGGGDATAGPLVLVPEMTN